MLDEPRLASSANMRRHDSRRDAVKLRLELRQDYAPGRRPTLFEGEYQVRPQFSPRKSTFGHDGSFRASLRGNLRQIGAELKLAYVMPGKTEDGGVRSLPEEKMASQTTWRKLGKSIVP